MSLVFVKEPTGEAYREVLRYCQRRSTHAAFVLQWELPSALDRVRHVLEPLKPFMVSSIRVSSWPGTRLIGGREVTLNRYLANDEVVAHLGRVASGLFDWTNPDFPDDLHFVTGDSVVLGQVAHERFAWIGENSEPLRLPRSIADLVEPRSIEGID